MSRKRKASSDEGSVFEGSVFGDGDNDNDDSMGEEEEEEDVPRKRSPRRPTPTPTPTPTLTPGGGDTSLKQKSAAEFFGENKNIAGFDNAGKSLYTSIRELVENSLDAAEEIRILPEVNVTITEITRETFNKIIGVASLERVNEELYQDFVTEAQRKKREAKEKKAQGRKKNADDVVKTTAAEETDVPTPKPTPMKRREMLYYKVMCKDNGRGMPHEDIPNMLGKVLSGTKYGVKQMRGKFGLGAKMALIWSKMSSGLPIEIHSARPDQGYISHCVLDINIRANTPRILTHEKLPNPEGWRGTEVCLTVGGNWTTYRSRILQYMRQLAIITPYAMFTLRFEAEDSNRSFAIRYARRTDTMPEPPRTTKHHPSSVNHLLLKQLIHDTKEKTLARFLSRDLSNITLDHARKLIGELGSDMAATMPVHSVSDNQIHQLVHLLRVAKFDLPDAKCLSPAGEYNLRLGIMKELHPEMVATFQGQVSVHEGHPFIVETGVSYGGRNVSPGINVYRFANRIPLLFEPGADVATRVATKKINWGKYKINKNTDRVGVFVSIVSTKIPFKGTGKEYVGDDIEEIADTVKHAVMQCCAQLKVKLVRRAVLREKQSRKKNLSRYIPNVTRAFMGVLETMTAHQSAQWTPEVQSIVNRVQCNDITREVLDAKLRKIVQQTGAEAALEWGTRPEKGEGVKKIEDLYLTPLERDRAFLPDLVHPCATLQLFENALVP